MVIVGIGVLAAMAGAAMLLVWTRRGCGAPGWGLGLLAGGCVVAGVPLAMGWLSRAQNWGSVPLEEVALWGTAGGLALAGIGVAIWGLVGRKPRGRECLRCSYDMIATAGMTCPECGRTARRERELVRRRRRRWAIAAGMSLVLWGGAVWVIVQVQNGTWPRYVPGRVLVFLMPHYANRSPLDMELRRRVPALTDPEGAGPATAAWDSFVARRAALAVRDRGAMESAMLLIQKLGSRAAAAVPILMPMLEDPSAATRRRALILLTEVFRSEDGLDAGALLEVARRMLGDEDPQVRLVAVSALASVLRERGLVIPMPGELAALWDAEDSPMLRGHVRLRAAQCLEHCEVDEAWWKVMESALQDPSAAARAAALSSLAARLPDDPRTAAAIEQALCDSSGQSRRSAVCVLLRRGARPDRIQEELLGFATLPENERSEAVWAISEVVCAPWPPEDKVRVLGRLLEDDALRPAVVAAAGQLGTSAALLLPQLREAAAAADAEAERLRALGPATHPSDPRPSITEIRAAEQAAREIHAAIDRIERAVLAADERSGRGGR